MKRLIVVISFFLAISLAILGGMNVTAVTKKSSSFISVSAKYLKPQRSVTATFGNLKNATSVSYTLRYEGNGIGQGVGGSFKVGKQKSISRRMILGTCSSGTCVYHKNVKNIKLEVVTKYKSGVTTNRSYSIK